MFLVVSGLLAFMSITGFAGMLNLGNLVPELLAPAEVFAGTMSTFRLRLHNHKRYLPSFLIRIECAGSPGITVPVVPHRGCAEARVPITFMTRGRARVGEVTVRSVFPVNFFDRYWKFSLGDTCLVYPRLEPAALVGAGDHAKQIGTAARQVRGFDGELEGIVEYSGREALKEIHWKHSARVDNLLVKEFGQVATAPLIIDLDKLGGASLETRISQAAWLVQRWINHRPVGLKLADREVSPAEGHHHKELLLTELALYGND